MAQSNKLGRAVRSVGRCGSNEQIFGANQQQANQRATSILELPLRSGQGISWSVNWRSFHGRTIPPSMRLRTTGRMLRSTTLVSSSMRPSSRQWVSPFPAMQSVTDVLADHGYGARQRGLERLHEKLLRSCGPAPRRDSQEPFLDRLERRDGRPRAGTSQPSTPNYLAFSMSCRS